MSSRTRSASLPFWRCSDRGTDKHFFRTSTSNLQKLAGQFKWTQTIILNRSVYRINYFYRWLLKGNYKEKRMTGLCLRNASKRGKKAFSQNNLVTFIKCLPSNLTSQSFSPPFNEVNWLILKQKCVDFKQEKLRTRTRRKVCHQIEEFNPNFWTLQRRERPTCLHSWRLRLGHLSNKTYLMTSIFGFKSSGVSGTCVFQQLFYISRRVKIPQTKRYSTLCSYSQNDNITQLKINWEWDGVRTSIHQSLRTLFRCWRQFRQQRRARSTSTESSELLVGWKSYRAFHVSVKWWDVKGNEPNLPLQSILLPFQIKKYFVFATLWQSVSQV